MLNRQFIKMADFTEPLHNFFKNAKNPLEDRVSTNNLLDMGKNKIRNAIMFKLSKRKEFLDYLTRLRKHWELWHINLAHMNKRATGVQNNYRKFLAKNKLNKLLKIKEAIVELYLIKWQFALNCGGIKQTS